jgi:glutaredoxin
MIAQNADRVAALFAEADTLVGQTMRCPVHDLAVPPEGQCVLCKRSQAAASGATAGRLGLAALGSVAAVCVAAIAFKLISSATHTGAVATTAAPPKAVPAREPAHETQQPVTNQPNPAAREPAAPALAAGPANDSDRTVVADQEQRPGAIDAPKPPSEADLRAALQSVRITLYSTEWCPHCTRARSFLQQNSIPFVEHDIEKDPEAKRAHRRLVPAGGVPVLDIDGDISSGFNEKRTARAIALATQRRLKQR